MSLYNLLHGENPFADILLVMLGLTRADVPRYRDCYWTGKHICIHTRTGGGNRDDYQDGNNYLTSLKTFVRDEDDDFDSTYANFYFAVPENFTWVIQQVQASDATPSQKWQSLFEKMKTIDKNDPQIAQAITVLEPIFKQINEALTKQ